MKVENYKTKNQFIIFLENSIIFQSYDAFILEIKDGEIVKVGFKWCYSKTTLKYLKMFINEYCKNYEYTTKKDFEKFLNNFWYYDSEGAYKIK